MIRRRAVLGAGVVYGVASGVALTGCTAGEADTPTPSQQFDPNDWASVRAQFALDPKLAHFASFLFASHPAPVRQAIDRHRAGLDADPAGYLEKDIEYEERVRTAAAEYLGAQPGDVALTDSTTMGTGLVCGGLKLKPGQDVLTTEHDFFGTYDALQKLTARTGARVRRVRLYDAPATATAGDAVTRLKAAIGPQTRLVVVTWVHSSTGVRLPVPEIAAMLRTVNAGRAPADQALLFVDGVHGFGAVDTKVADLGCDFFTTGTHKWLHGPRGTGVLWSKSWDAIAPVIPSFSMPDAPGRLATPGGYHSAEHRWALAEAFEFHAAIGRSRIGARITEQATQLKDGLAGIASVTLATPKAAELSAGLVMCSIDGVAPHQAAGTLRRDHGIVASVTPYNDPLLRFGPGIVTTPEEVERVVKAVASIN
ncbi:aminotransferase class V-fold PLP-dependent enzyme [Kribbella sp. CA-247076]|uniref:aminotransferase class V-fold PLP-dependent enzyme n=1 Tax=Kribbella sp. CA-247076 TaxID=3239941 RepID=UPI003D90A8CE